MLFLSACQIKPEPKCWNEHDLSLLYNLVCIKKLRWCLKNMKETINDNVFECFNDYNICMSIFIKNCFRDPQMFYNLYDNHFLIFFSFYLLAKKAFKCLQSVIKGMVLVAQLFLLLLLLLLVGERFELWSPFIIQCK